MQTALKVRVAWIGICLGALVVITGVGEVAAQTGIPLLYFSDIVSGIFSHRACPPMIVPVCPGNSLANTVSKPPFFF